VAILSQRREGSAFSDRLNSRKRNQETISIRAAHLQACGETVQNPAEAVGRQRSSIILKQSDQHRGNE